MNIPLIKGRAELGMGSNYFEVREDWNILNHNYSTIFRLTTQPGLITVVEWKGNILFPHNFQMDAMRLVFR